MAKQTGFPGYFYYHGHDISGDVGSLDAVNSTVNLLNVTGLNKDSMERIQGLGTGTISFRSFWNSTCACGTPIHGAVSGLASADRVALYHHGTCVGNVAAGLEGKLTSYAPTRGADGSLTTLTTVEGGNGAPLEWLSLLTGGKVTQASSGATASKDDTAQSCSGLAGYLEAVDIDSGTPTVVIQDSANNCTWATLVSFTAIADGCEPTGQRVTVSGQVCRYLRLNITGTFTNLDYVVAYRRGVDCAGCDSY